MNCMRRAIVGVVAAMALLTGCAGPSRAHKLGLNERLATRDWAAAEAQIEASKEKEYGQRNAVLFFLDKAAVLQAAGRYQESDALLDQAELRMEELYTRSVSKGAATFAVNDNADDYRGEPHERALLHVLRALNYAFQYRADEAVVEARKVSEFLTGLGETTPGRIAYRDDAFARYLSALLFEDAGRFDDARIARDNAAEAYGWYRDAYGVEPPMLDGEAPPEYGELVLVHYNGSAPRRESQTIQVAWNDAIALVAASEEKEGNQKVENAVRAGLMANTITVAFPAQVQDEYRIRQSELVTSAERVPTVVVEDISSIAAKALDEKIAAIRVKAIARATIKFVVAKVVENETKKRAGAAAGLLVGIAGRAAAAGSEVADTRCWSTLPAEIRMARVRLPPGSHSVTVNYLDRSGAVFLTEKLEVEIQAARRTYVQVKTTA
jgi:hypothetical protein